MKLLKNGQIVFNKLSNFKDQKEHKSKSIKNKLEKTFKNVC